MIQYDPEIMPDDIRAEKKFTDGIYILDLFVLIFSFGVAWITRTYVFQGFQIAYVVGFIIIGVYVTRQSTLNPKKRIFESMYIYISRPTENYESIVIEEEPAIEETEALYESFKA